MIKIFFIAFLLASEFVCFAVPKKQWLLLRGLSREHRHWGDFPQVLKKALGPDVEIIMIDFPGTGDYIHEPSPGTIPEITDFVREKFFKHPAYRENVETHVLALSMGGMVAMDWLHRFPKEFASAVLVGTSHKYYSPWFKRIYPPSLLRGIAGVLIGDVFNSVYEQERAILHITCNNQACRESVEKEWVEIQEHDPVRTRTILSQLLAAAFYVPPTEPPRVPVLLMHGQDDRIASVSCSKTLAKAWGMELLIKKHVGHDVTLEAGPWVAAHVANWAKTH